MAREFRFVLVLMLCCLYNTPFVAGQGSVSFQCNEPLTPGIGRKIGNDSSKITVSMVKFYLQQLTVSRNDKILWTSTESHLIDLSDTNKVTLAIPLSLGKNDCLTFTLGIDSATCVSGVKDGDLDPSKGMYWTWRSGYINMKVEGTADRSKSSDHAFQLHLGGYAHPYPTARVVTRCLSNPGNPTFSLSLEKFLSQTDLSSKDHVMTPGESAATLSQAAAASFEVIQP